MSCQEVDKIYCCTYIHSHVRTKTGLVTQAELDSLDNKVKQKRLITCRLICPDECVDVGSDGDNLWVERVQAANCDSCDDTENGCNKNRIVLFDMNTCSASELMLTKSEYDTTVWPANKIILHRKQCVTDALSVEDPESYKNLLNKAQQKNSCETEGACCFVLENGDTEELICEEKLEQECTAEVLQRTSKHYSTSTVIIGQVRFTPDQLCSAVNCSDMSTDDSGYCLVFDDSSSQYNCVSNTQSQCRNSGQFFSTLDSCETQKAEINDSGNSDPESKGVCCFTYFDKLSGKYVTESFLSLNSDCIALSGDNGVYNFQGVGTTLEMGLCSPVNLPANPSPPASASPAGSTSPPTSDDLPPEPTIQSPGFAPVDSEEETVAIDDSPDNFKYVRTINIQVDNPSDYQVNGQVVIFDTQGNQRFIAKILEIEEIQ